MRSLDGIGEGGDVLAAKDREIAALREALEAQMAVSVRCMKKLGFSLPDMSDCTAQARNALAHTAPDGSRQ
jgi:hypothetical protein